MPDRPWVLLPAGRRLAIPTKTPLTLSQFSGRLDSSDRVPLHVLSTSFSGRALHWYLFQRMRMRSRSSLSFRVAIVWCLVSWGVGGLFRVSGSSLKSLLQRVFHRRKAHSDAAIN